MAINTSKGAAWEAFVEIGLADHADDAGLPQKAARHRSRAIELYRLAEKLRIDEAAEETRH